MLWNENTPFPAVGDLRRIDGIEHIPIHRAIGGGYQFLLGAAIVKHDGRLYASWLNSWRRENDPYSVLAQKCSLDGGRAWQDDTIIAGASPDGFCHSHGVYLSYGGRLYAYCPRAKFDYDVYRELVCEVWELTEGGWVCRGNAVNDRFWPLCEPIRVGDHWVMAGLETERAQAAVALSNGSDLFHWRMVEIPNPDGIKCWGETTVIDCGDHLHAVVRDSDNDRETALESESYDGGCTWTPLRYANLPMACSKPCGGILPNGERYLIFNAAGRWYRRTLVIAVGKEAFERVYIIRDEDLEMPRFHNGPQEWSYPYAHIADDKLYVVYDQNKEDCELAILPLASLEK